MDSLLATYASSDDEEEERHNSAPPPHPPPSFIATKSSSLFLSFPKPKLPQHPPNPSSSIQHEDDEEEEDPNPKPKNSRVGRSFLSLPQTKSQKPLSTPSNPKRVVQFKPPISSFSSSIKSTDLDDEDDDDDRDNKDRERKSQSLAQSVSVTSFLSSIPAPKNSSATLGAMPSSGSGRRSIVEADVPASSRENSAGADKDSGTHPNSGSYVDQNPGNHVDYGNYELGYDQNAGNYEVVQNSGSYVNYDAYGNYQSEPATTGNYYGGSNESYENNWSDGLMPNTVPEIAGKKKRGRNEVPTEIVEVKQDELMKNRPREDQTKATGIAFGPSYQPVSTKGKPTKLHKRKHQIGSLFYDMKQKETELAERRSRGFLTKAETQAKYGW